MKKTTKLLTCLLGALGLGSAPSVQAAPAYKFQQVVQGVRAATCPLPWGETLVEGQTYASPAYTQASVAAPASCSSVAISLSCAGGQLSYPTPVKSCSVSYDAAVSLLLHFDNNATDVKGATPTAVGLGYTTTHKFGGYAANFNGSSYITYPASTSRVDWVGADFTVEAWVYPLTGSTWTNGAGYPSLVGNMQEGGGTNYWSFGPTNSGKLAFYYWNGGTNLLTSSNSLTYNAWNHIAMTKTSGTIRLFVNGQLGLTQAVNGTPLVSTVYPLTVGSYSSARVNGGYVDDLRITRGAAIYTDNFTPPAQAF